MERREAVRVELPSVLKDTRWAQLHISPTAEGISVVFRDITEQRRLQDSILRHQERLHRALEAARMAAWEYDPRLDRVTYSASASDVLGVPADRLPHDRAHGHRDDPSRRPRGSPGDRAARGTQCRRPIPIPVPAGGRLPVRPPRTGVDRGSGPHALRRGRRADVGAGRGAGRHRRSRHRGTHPRAQRGPAGTASRNARRCSKPPRPRARPRSDRAGPRTNSSPCCRTNCGLPCSRCSDGCRSCARRPWSRTTSGRALDTIERNLRQQTQLINDMLDVSRIVTGKLVFHLATLPLAGVVRETVDELRPQADAKGLDRRAAVKATCSSWPTASVCARSCPTCSPTR